MEQSSTPGTAPSGPAPRSKWGTSIAVALLLAVVAGVAGYFIGHSAADAKGAEDKGVSKGEAEYAQGTPGYKRIYQAGLAAGAAKGAKAGRRVGAEQGRKVGLEQGEKIGDLKGEQQGIASGANAALGGFGDWQPNSYYLVQLAPGTGGVPFRIVVRKSVAPNERYAVCADNSAVICSEPIEST
jgi:hypothetical protein